MDLNRHLDETLRRWPGPLPAPIGARLARAAAWSLCRAAARLYRAATAMERREPPDDERHHVQALLVSYGKLD